MIKILTAGLSIATAVYLWPLLLNLLALPNLSHLININRSLEFKVEERNQLYNELKESEQRLELALSATKGGIWDWDILSGTCYFSPQFLKTIGYSSTELEHKVENWKRLIHPNDVAHASDLLQSYFENKTLAYEVEFRLLTKSGDWQWHYNRGKVVK